LSRLLIKMLLAPSCISFMPTMSGSTRPVTASRLGEVLMNPLPRSGRFWTPENRVPDEQLGTLILIRHGPSEASNSNSFVGWSDPDLSAIGEKQTLEAARAIVEAGHSIDVVYTSLLKRAVRTSWLMLQHLGKIYLPVWKHWRLNERCYGALTGESVTEMQRRYGEETVASWRRALDARPPPFPPGHADDPSTDPRYTRWQDRRGKIRPAQCPNGESMA